MYYNYCTVNTRRIFILNWATCRAIGAPDVNPPPPPRTYDAPGKMSRGPVRSLKKGGATGLRPLIREIKEKSP
jgi:hypothetical protein